MAQKWFEINWKRLEWKTKEKKRRNKKQKCESIKSNIELNYTVCILDIQQSCSVQFIGLRIQEIYSERLCGVTVYWCQRAVKFSYNSTSKTQSSDEVPLSFSPIVEKNRAIMNATLWVQRDD